MEPEVEVVVRSERFKFNAAHFVAFPGYRERLHGHNYTVGIRLLGPISPLDGYVMDFGDIKKTTREVCAELNERFLCPTASDVMRVSSVAPDNVTLRCEDGSFFSLPADDCALLPIAHSTAEELAAMLWRRIIERFGIHVLRSRGITKLEVSVAEAPAQEARYLRHIDAFDAGGPDEDPAPASRSQLSRCVQHAVVDRGVRELFDLVYYHTSAEPFAHHGDLVAIGEKLEAGDYPALEDLGEDLKRMVDHSRRYNAPDTALGHAADTLDLHIDCELARLRQARGVQRARFI